MFDVITVGSAMIDIFAKTEFSKTLKSKGKDFMAYPVGSKILIDELIFTTGGGGTNTAVSLARLGHKVAFLGKIGSKDDSQRIIDELRKEKVDTSLIVQSSKNITGHSIILDSIKHDRTILTFRGSNSSLKFNEINIKKLKTKWFYFSSMMKESFKTLEKLSVYAKKKDIKIVLNLSPYLVRKGPKVLRKLLNNTNILILNKEEASILAGKNKVNILLQKLHKLGPEIVAVSDGKHGVYVFDGSYVYYGKPNKIKVIETTGAGDAFASSFLSGIIRKNDIEFAMRLGMTNAESVIQYHGAKNKLLKYNEALKIMNKRSIKVTKRRL